MLIAVDAAPIHSYAMRATGESGTWCGGSAGVGEDDYFRATVVPRWPW